jgi:hypothetical protein
MSSDPFSQNPYQAPVESSVVSATGGGGKSRHGCATAYLIFMIIVNALVSLSNVMLGASQSSPVVPGWLFFVLALFGCLNVVFAVALLRWKKWGFYGFMASALLIAVINALSIGLGGALIGLLGVAVLYGVLQIGGNRNTWSQLE